MKHPVYLIFKALATIFLLPSMEVEGAENLPEGPAIVVGNHSQAYGPVAAEIYFPGRHYTWCISEMMEKDKVADYAYKDFWSKKPAIERPFFKLLSHIIPVFAQILFTNAATIPVYRDKRIMRTFQISCDRLKEPSKVIIFPEDYTKYNNIVYHFQRGFVLLAGYYYRQTKASLPFVPMYVCPKLKKLVIGKPIYYSPEGKSSEEAERICTYLQDTISEMAYNQPRHRVVPYPNVSRKHYPLNIKENEKTSS